MKKGVLAVLVVLGGLGAVIGIQVPEIKRYLKIREM
jgi:hypothetical protein